MKLHLNLHSLSHQGSSPWFPAAFHSAAPQRPSTQRSRTRAVAYIAFFAMVFACMAAAAAMVSNDIPLMMGAL
ncbi:MAG: hypothetical protein ABIP46_05370 [Polaromonas sp.]